MCFLCIKQTNMDWITLLLGLAGGGSVVGLIVGIVTIPSAVKKAAAAARKEEAEAKQTEVANMKSVADGWKELADERQEANKEKDERITFLMKQIDERYVDIGDWRDKYNHQQKEIASLEVKIAGMLPKICEKRGCEDRTPPTGY